MRGGAQVPYSTTGRGRAGGVQEGGGGKGSGPHSGLLRWWRGPRGSRTQGCKQHGPPQDEVPLRREGSAGQWAPGASGRGGPSSKQQTEQASLHLSAPPTPELP